MNGEVALLLPEDLEAFVRERFAVTPADTGFGRDVDLWDQGYIDSVGVVELIAFLEKKMGITLPENIVFDPEFRTINSIVRLLTPYTASAV